MANKHAVAFLVSGYIRQLLVDSSKSGLKYSLFLGAFEFGTVLETKQWEQDIATSGGKPNGQRREMKLCRKWTRKGSPIGTKGKREKKVKGQDG